MTKSNFDQALDNYRNSVVKILPDYISGRLSDPEALADELGLLLYSRDVLARALASADAAAQARLSETEQLDQQLLDLKDSLLPLAPFYISLRERKPRPRSQWWYYLDEIVFSPPDVSATKTAAGYWLPLTPHPVAA